MNKLETPKPDLLDSIPKAMQSLAFWVGYQHSQLPHRALPEAALVSEFYRLLTARIGEEDLLVPECAYSLLGVAPEEAGRERIDIVIAEHKGNEEVVRSTRPTHKLRGVKALIEVKRAHAPTANIKQDLLRLSRCLTDKPQTQASPRAFLLLVSEAHGTPAISRDVRLLDDKGHALRHAQRVAVTPTRHVLLRVRRVCRASSSNRTKTPRSTHYVVLVEVLLKGVSRQPSPRRPGQRAKARAERRPASPG